MRAKRRLEYLLHSPQLFSRILFRGNYKFQFDLMDMQSNQMPLSKRINLLKAGMNLIHRKMNPWSWPIHMQVELTNYCNLKCEVCPTGSGILGRKPASMEPVLFERLINEVGPYLLTVALFAWGEPLLHPRLAEILRIVHNRGINVILSTNGQNLDDPEVQQALIDYPPTYLIVAVDGITDTTNSLFRVGAKLEPALKGVKEIARMKKVRSQQYPILHHRFIVMKHNEHELPQLRQFASENQFDLLTIRTLSVIDAPDDKNYNKYVPDNKAFRAYQYNGDEILRRKDFICEYFFTYPTVLADGSVIACDQDYKGQLSYGTIADGASFADIWWGKKAADMRRTISSNLDKYSTCRNCPYRDRPVNDCSIQRFELKN